MKSIIYSGYRYASEIMISGNMDDYSEPFEQMGVPHNVWLDVIFDEHLTP